MATLVDKPVLGPHSSHKVNSSCIVNEILEKSGKLLFYPRLQQSEHDPFLGFLLLGGAPTI